MTSQSTKRTELLLQKSEQESERLLQIVGDISILWNSTYNMIIQAMRLRIPLQNWLDEEVLLEPYLEHLSSITYGLEKIEVSNHSSTSIYRVY
jgi:hypothetical protein